LLSKLSNKRFRAGFTLIELLVALAVAAVLLGMALPAFNNLVEQRTMAARVNEFVTAVNLARSEAIKRGGPVSIQVAGAAAADNEWGNGYCVTANPGNCNTPLRVFDATGGATMDATGDLDGQGTLTYNGRGLLTLGGQGTIELCSTDAGINPGREIAVNTIGRAASVELVCAP
jgi:type IV fimbrial biogenesis protein FimT